MKLLSFRLFEDFEDIRLFVKLQSILFSAQFGFDEIVKFDNFSNFLRFTFDKEHHAPLLQLTINVIKYLAPFYEAASIGIRGLCRSVVAPV